ncbi:molybdenum cofactor sulfurase-like [Quillaja saponaria]|uniref:Molybdenum cofactor sulfurase-like n=1 Tax=Quillaja saponaria TaxID=32244 RepID=A0AAD7KSC0_QUISA|nr:molybdenum cofactor sulfurase-like [Quillaja saponaria]
MHSSCIREASQTCFNVCLSNPFDGSAETHTPNSTVSATGLHYDFAVATASTLQPYTQLTNHESLPSLEESFLNFTGAYPQFSSTRQAEDIRAREYYHLSPSNHVCLDYIGHGLFSYDQQQRYYPPTASVASSSSSAPPLLHSTISELPFFDISYKSVNFNSQILYGNQESELESNIQKRIMAFMNISEADYTMVFTANQSSAFRLVADSYQFQPNKNLLTVYDHTSEALEVMIENSKKRGAQILSAEFSWPNLRIQSRKLKKMIMSKRRKKRKSGLLVFPLQSRMTGARYSYLWMTLAQENGWHVLLDACALGSKEMDTLGLSLFKPDFLVCSFFKVFGENPSGFGCLFVKKSSSYVLKRTDKATSIGIVSLVPTSRQSQFPEQIGSEVYRPHRTKEVFEKQKAEPLSEIVELETPIISAQCSDSAENVKGNLEIECRGLDHADSLGLILISGRARYLINWLVNALMRLQHPHSETGLSLIRIYGPNINYHRGPAVAFNVFDWKGEKIEPALIQKLADRHNISLSYGFLENIWFSYKSEEERQMKSETRTPEVEGTGLPKKTDKHLYKISVVTAALGFLTNFEDTYRLWKFISRFLDADFVEKEKWRYMALNQKTIEV